MKLSEAIRLGSMLAPQGYGRVEDENGRTCAMGAGFKAGGVEVIEIPAAKTFEDYIGDPEMAYLREARWAPEGDHIIRRLFRIPLSLGWPLDHFTSCPYCTTVSGTVPAVAAHLNDLHGLTREQIADWVETVETQIAATQPSASPGCSTPAETATTTRVEPQEEQGCLAGQSLATTRS